MTGQRLRGAVIGDAEAIADLHLRAWRSGYRGLVADESLDQLDREEWASHWRQRLGQPPREGVHILVSADDDRPVAVAAFGPAPEANHHATGELYLLYVDPDRWGQGHGGALLTEAHRRLAADGHDAAMLWTLPDNERTHAVYARHGWSPDGATRTETVHGIVVDEVRFIRELP